MAENLLIHVLLGEIQLDHLLEWIKRKQFVSGEISKFRCTQADFLTYFLNYIHSEAPCSNAIVDNTQKIFAPKPVKRQSVEEGIVKRQSASLFNADVKCDALDSKQIDSNLGFSTPKVIRAHAEIESNSTYMSPVSPLYSNTNFNTPRNKRPPNSAQKSSERSFCLGDFIAHKTNSGKKKVQKNLNDSVENESKSKKSRRINPTKLNQRKHEGNFQELENSFNFQNEFVELRVDNTNEQRSLLVEERMKIASEIKFDDVTKLSSHYNLHKANKTEVKADSKLVTHMKELDVLAKIYGCVLVNNLALNFTSELYFLILLLVTKRYVGESEEEDDCVAIINTQSLSSDEVDFLVTNALFLKTLLKTVHNSAYFAVRTLSLLANILQFLDRSTIKLLVENEAIKEYRVGRNLLQNLLVICEHRAEQLGGFVEGNQANNVCFILDTDNRENFPSDASFHAFRKQRDLFYDILRIWEQNHCVSGWSFSIALGGKIKSLLNLYSDPVNFRHFARLFKAQLLTTCRSHGNEEGMTETEMSFLSSIPNIDADKLCRLKSRLVTKQVTEGINALPQFPGHQEFYKEFIVSSSVHAFHVHLRDALISEILQLNDTRFCDSELNDTEVNVDVTTRSSYVACIKSLRVLAKFLGFLESLSYKIDCKVLSEKVLASEIKTRLWIQSAFDLKRTVINAIENRTLILTIPWLTKYLSMLDYVTLRLPYYESVLKLLFHVHLNCKTASLNDLLLRLCLGWLFELPHFPSDLYFSWYTQEATGDLMLDDDCEERNARRSLDELRVVDSNVLYVCCPYLDEIKKLLVFNGGSNGTVVKHITPLSAVDSAADVSEKKLKAQLEEAFFNGQPVSVRKTVEFISERVASASVKFICNTIVPCCKKSFAARVQDVVPDESESHTPDRNKAESVAQEYLKMLQVKCSEEAEKMAGERVPVSVDMLLSPDELVQVKETCSMIAKRMCVSRVQQWMNSHVNLGIFNSEIQKVSTNHAEKAKDKPAFLLPPDGRETPHNPGTQSAVKLVENIRQLSLDVLEKNPNVTAVEVNAVLDCVKTSVQERCDVNDNILSVINRMLLDLYLLLLAHRCDISAEEPLVMKLVDHWKLFARLNEDLFKTVFRPRNMMLLAQSRDVKKTWEAFTQFVILLLKKGLLSSEALESQCVMMYRNEWDEATLKRLSCCFQAIVDEFALSEGNFTYLLSFISGFCSDMDVL